MSSPKPLGHYGLNLDISTEIAIDNLKLHELTNLLCVIAGDLDTTHYLLNKEAAPIDEETMDSTSDLLKQSDIDKIGAIRGLCDRIELKLMEAAK